MGSEQVLVVGLDGVDFRYLDQFADDLPNIMSIRERGVESPLRATHPPWTGSAWPSMYTGQDPSHHGIYDFFDYQDAYPDEATIASRNDVDAPAIWNYLSELDLTSVVLNVPVTHPAEAIDGVLLPGYLAPSDADGYPENIRDELAAELGEEYRIYSESETSGDTDTKISDFESLIRHRAAAASYLLESREWDFAFVQIQKTDAVFHNSEREQDFRRIYEAADDLVGRLLDSCDSETNVAVVSDHGIGPVTGQEVYVNEVLREAGYIETQSNPSNLGLSKFKEGADTGGGTPSSLTRAVDAARRLGFDPASAYRVAEHLGIEKQVLSYLPRSLKQSLAEGVDWRTSQAYCRRNSEQGVRINLEGRDPNGVVPPEQYETVREEIITLLSELTTEDDEPVFELVCPREEVYDGPYTEEACDILLRTIEMNHQVSTHFHGRTFDSVDTFNHKQHGVFVAAGPDVSTTWSGADLSLLDVAPVLFALLNQPIPDRLTGTPPDGLVTNDAETRAYDEVPYGGDTAYSQNRSEVTDRLEDLGYL